MTRLSTSARAALALPWLLWLPTGALAGSQAAPGEPAGGFVRRDGTLFQLDAAGRAWRVEPRVISLRWRAPVSDLGALRARLTAPDRALLEGAVTLRTNRLGIADVRLAEGRDPLEVVRRLSASGLLEFAELNTFGEWLGTPNDPSYSQQWGLKNSGQTGGTPGADINVEPAWDLSSGDPAILVAVIDSGTDVFHADLLANRYENPGELANGLDDDGNGLIDDFYGWDFANDENDVTSNIGHGTQVAGVLGARTDNGQGVAGVAGGFGAQDGCTFLVCQIGDSFPLASAIDDGILYAADQGARVITMSLGISATAAINAALDYAANTKGVFINCASGNAAGTNNVSYPASNVNVVAVGSSGKTDAVSATSSGGPQLWVVAPGELIFSTTLFGGYINGTGTSFSSPHIAGIAALMLSLDPSLTRQELADILKDTAVDIGAPGFDVMAGWGRVDAGAALAAAAANCGVSSFCAAVANSSGNAAAITASGTTSVAANDLVLHVSSLPTQQNGLFFYGPGELQLPFGPGYLCVQGPLQRLAIVNSGAGGAASFALDITSPPQASGQINAGSQWSFQLWYRDPAAGGVAYNTSDGLTVRFCP